MRKRQQKGVSLIEMTILIIVIGIAGVALMSSYVSALRQLPDLQTNDMAVGLAQGRMEIILGQFREKGFESGSDICSASPGLALCALPSGYTVSSTITGSYNGDSNMKQVTVTVSGSGNATLTSVTTRHE